MKRQLIYLAAAAALLCTAASSQSVVKIWPGKAPGTETWTLPERTIVTPSGDQVIMDVSDPSYTIYLPDPAKATGVAVVVCPGGGLRELGWTNSGTKVAEWLNSKGVAAFVLKYRTLQIEPPPDHHSYGPPSSPPPPPPMKTWPPPEYRTILRMALSVRRAASFSSPNGEIKASPTIETSGPIANHFVPMNPPSSNLL